MVTDGVVVMVPGAGELGGLKRGALIGRPLALGTTRTHAEHAPAASPPVEVEPRIATPLPAPQRRVPIAIAIYTQSSLAILAPQQCALPFTAARLLLHSPRVMRTPA